MVLKECAIIIAAKVLKLELTWFSLSFFFGRNESRIFWRALGFFLRFSHTLSAVVGLSCCLALSAVDSLFAVLGLSDGLSLSDILAPSAVLGQPF